MNALNLLFSLIQTNNLTHLQYCQPVSKFANLSKELDQLWTAILQPKEAVSLTYTINLFITSYLKFVLKRGDKSFNFQAFIHINISF